MKKSSFAFIVHPLNMESMQFILGKNAKFFRKTNNYFLKNILKFIPPFKYIHLKRIRSQLGMDVEGYIIICPLLPEQFVTLNKAVTRKKIISGGKKLAENVNKTISGGKKYFANVKDNAKDFIEELS